MLPSPAKLLATYTVYATIVPKYATVTQCISICLMHYIQEKIFSNHNLHICKMWQKSHKILHYKYGILFCVINVSFKHPLPLASAWEGRSLHEVSLEVTPFTKFADCVSTFEVQGNESSCCSCNSLLRTYIDTVQDRSKARAE